MHGRPGQLNTGGKGGFTLVIVLGMIVLLSILLLIFVAAASKERQASFSYSQSVAAEQLAEGGANLVLGNFRQEIMDSNRSTVVAGTGGAGSTYLPTSNADCVPEVMQGAVPATLLNVVKISSSTVPFYQGQANPLLAAASRSDAASVDGRRMTLARWNRARLIDASAENDLPAPEWVVVTRNGVATSWSDTLKDRSSSSAAVGRFAYVVYDVGGLLDINSAGYPASLATTSAGSAAIRQKGPMPFADLGQFPALSSQDDLVHWRNLATAGGDYVDYAKNAGAKNGFLRVAAGDRTFVSRQDLIQYSQTNPGVIGADVLPFLTTFTRELNAPSYGPATPAGSNVDYASLAKASGATNPHFATVYKPDGSTLTRFPLSRLALLQDPGGNAAAIRQSFGLTQDADGYAWDYAEANTDFSIKTLAQVIAAGRDPNFFELLQAAIMNGSLGLSTYQSLQSIFHGSDYLDGNKTRQILAIGANIIDQYDADSMPTVIHVPGDTRDSPVVGIENLPSISEVVVSAYRPTVAEGNDNFRQRFVMHLQFVVWNPHQNAGQTSNGPSKLRVVARGGKFHYKAVNINATTPPPTLMSSPGMDYAAAYSANTPYQIQFQNQTAFAEPTMLTPSNSTNPDPNGIVGNYSGIYMGGISSMPDNRINGNPTPYQYAQIFFQPEEPGPYGNSCFTLEAQFLDTKGNWQTYQKIPYGINYAASGFDVRTCTLTKPPNERYWLDHDCPPMAFSRVDPRGSRWAMSATYVSSGHMTILPDGQTVRPDGGEGVWGGAGRGAGPAVPGAANFQPGGEGTYDASTFGYIGMLSDNPSIPKAGESGYVDPDQVMRPADGNTAQGVLPLASGHTLDRPVILNRPFSSVAELGYVFRDMPWKTLDLFSGESADAGLLDVFSVCDDSQTPRQLVAGKVNINTKRPEVLSCLLAGAALRESDASQNISAATAKRIATDLVQYTTATPLRNKAELVTGFGGAQHAQFGADYPARKTEREAMIRALANVAQTRTWNLLIDVVAQSGRFPPTASTFDQFHVDGERRYWFHVAIDRYTGKVLEMHAEPVYE